MQDEDNEIMQFAIQQSLMESSQSRVSLWHSCVCWEWGMLVFWGGCHVGGKVRIFLVPLRGQPFSS